MIDLHQGGGFEGISDAIEALATPEIEGWGVMVLETNNGVHSVQRMLAEAQDLNRWALFPDVKLLGRTGSFCNERSGYQEGRANDQGITFFLPNMTWMQPPAYVYAMNAAAAQPLAIKKTTTGSMCNLGLLLDAQAGDPSELGEVSAQVSEDRSRLVVRVVNALPVPKNFTLSVHNMDIVSAQVTTISGWPSGEESMVGVGLPRPDPRMAGANTPAQPKRFAPKPPQSIDPSATLQLDPYSYSVVEIKLEDAKILYTYV